MNPTIDEGLIQRELERDAEGAQAEWLATFRTDLQRISLQRTVSSSEKYLREKIRVGSLAN